MIKPKVNSELSYEDVFIRINFVVFSRIIFKLENKTQNPIEIDWASASFVDTDSRAHRIIHEGVRYIERDKASPPTIVPAGANIRDTILPADYVSYESGSSSGWKVEDILEGKLAKYEGKTIGILLPIRLRGVLKNYQFTFRIEKDLVATANRTASRTKERTISSDELVKVPITKKDFGNNWPLTINDAVLACGRTAVFLIVGPRVYALNGSAAGMLLDGKLVSNDIAEIGTDSAGLAILRNKGLGLCK